MFKFKNDEKVKDTMTGATCVVTACIAYAGGQVSYRIQQITDDGVVHEELWLEERRLAALDSDES